MRADLSIGASTAFRTDTDISGSLAMRERNLQRWEPSSTEISLDMSLESSGTGGWDQFETNQRLFGATTSYDENIYTTRIDRSDPAYRRKEAEAARIAREIEATGTENPHLREERGHAPEGDGHDEEERYSGVRREDTGYPPLQSGQPNKYTPPARRPPGQQQPAGSRVPHADPAIISAQLAKPETASKEVSQPKARVSDATQEKATKSATSSQNTLPEQNASVAGSTATGSKRAGAAENATSNVETEVLDHFRQFANNEKMKMQERRRNQASHDRTVKLNELMKFSQNFKLATPVPKDLVPILAKDPNKQEEIIEKAQRQADEKTTTTTSPPLEQKPTVRGPAPPRSDTTAATVPPSAPADRQNYPRGRQGYPPSGPHVGAGGRMPNQTFHPGRPGTLSHRLADNLRQQKNTLGAIPPPLPIQDARIPPSGPSGDQSGVSSPNKVHTPTSAVSSRFNVRAMEFKPNPAASTFTPGSTGAATSPQLSSRGRSVSRTTTPSAFFGYKKLASASERPSLKDQCNPIKRMKKENARQTEKVYTFNGGIPPPYKTAPTWDVAPGNEEKTYGDMFKTPPSSISPQSRSSSNPHVAHQSQLPYNVQQGSQHISPAGGPPHGSHHLQPQQHSGSHFDDHHRMQLSASTSQMYASPRLQHSHAAYPSPMAPHAQLAFGQPAPQFYHNQGGPQAGNMRQYPGGPQFMNPQTGMGAPMMVQQPSSGPYMGMPQGMGAPYNPQMQMYSPSPAHAYPQHAGPPPQPHSGYPSPSRGAPMMIHQGSQPGQPPQPVMYMNPGQHGQPMYTPQQGHGKFMFPKCHRRRWLIFPSAPDARRLPSAATFFTQPPSVSALLSTSAPWSEQQL
jgi:hypothetical protein